MSRLRMVFVCAFIGVGCREPSRATTHTSPPPSAVASAASSSRPRARRGGMNVTFAVVSDTHVGYGYPADIAKLQPDARMHPVGLEKDNARMIARLNGITGKAYPPDVGGSVGTPRGVVVTGDLTEWGREEEWTRFVDLFVGRSPTGKEAALALPLFEMVGNHDKVARGPWIEEQVGLRHGGRHYAWDWDDLHLVALGEAPDSDGLVFLERDLARVGADVPVVVFFHRALLGPWSADNWFDDDLKDRLRRTLAGHRVVAIFHGHHHATGHYRWNGIDVWKPGAVKNDAHTFAVVHVTDTTWMLASYDWEREVWASTTTKAL